MNDLLLAEINDINYIVYFPEFKKEFPQLLEQIDRAELDNQERVEIQTSPEGIKIKLSESYFFSWEELGSDFVDKFHEWAKSELLL